MKPKSQEAGLFFKTVIWPHPGWENWSEYAKK